MDHLKVMWKEVLQPKTRSENIVLILFQNQMIQTNTWIAVYQEEIIKFIIFKNNGFFYKRDLEYVEKMCHFMYEYS
jgi:hypothetical protein